MARIFPSVVSGSSLSACVEGKRDVTLSQSCQCLFSNVRTDKSRLFRPCKINVLDLMFSGGNLLKKNFYLV